MIYLALLPGGFLGSNGRDWRSMDIARIEARFREAGVALTTLSMAEALAQSYSPDDVLWLGSHMNPAVNRYVGDIAFLATETVRVVPRYPLLLAYENKGFQYLLARHEGFPTPDGGYVFREADLPARYPYVLKTASGAGSSGVHLVRSDTERRRVSARVFPWPMLDRIKVLLKAGRIAPRDRAHYRLFRGPLGQAAYQAFIPGLDHDFKVRVFGEKFYVMKRYVRAGSFRASGSNRTEYPSEASRVLDFSEQIFAALDTPYASLDVAQSDDACRLIEYQATNFGINTLVGSPGFFRREGGAWRFFLSRFSLEDDVAHAVIQHLAAP